MDAAKKNERGPNEEIIHTHDPAYIDLECHGCHLTHDTHGPDLIFRWYDNEIRCTQQEWVEKFYAGDKT